MTSITVLAGERTIGGTQIMVEDGGARLLFDCGLVYDPAGNPFGQVRQRSWCLLADLLTLGVAPYVPGVYAPRWLDGLPTALRPVLPPLDGPLAVALSHAHLDHSHLAGFVDPDVPVIVSSATARIVETLEVLGNSLAPAGRGFTPAEPEQPFAIGPMRVQLLPVDHDVSGARGMLIHTSSGTIAYAGDLRLHGSAPERSLAFARAARIAGARLLILEGTRLWPLDPQTGVQAPEPPERREEEVSPLVAETLAAESDQLGIILLTPENGERVEALATAMQAIGRLLVLDVEGLLLVTAALGRPLAAPHAVYLPGSLERSLADPPELPADVQLHAAIDAAPMRLSAAAIAADPGRFLLRLDWPHFADLLDLLPEGAGGVLFHANGLPLGPFDPAWQQLEWWARRLALRFVAAGSSGHAIPADLTRIAEECGAPVVMGIHSRHPELLRTGGARLLLPVRGQRYDLDRLD